MPFIVLNQRLSFSSAAPLISLPATSFRDKKSRISNIVETNITNYPKLNSRLIRNRERKAAGLPKITMLNRDKYVGPRTIFMDKLLSSQDESIKIIYETFYNKLNVEKGSFVSNTPPVLLNKEVPDSVKQILSLNMASKSDLFDTRREVIIRALQAHPSDTASPEVVIGIYTNSIIQLIEHLKNNRHDFLAQKLLIQKIQRRRRVLIYLKRLSLVRYFDLMNRLGIVHTDLV